MLKVITLFNTVKDLRIIQIYYLIKYFFFPNFIIKQSNLKLKIKKRRKYIFFLKSKDKLIKKNQFLILQKKIFFNKKWLEKTDLLLKYNFFYFNFITNKDKIIKSFVLSNLDYFLKKTFKIEGFWDPYPTSIRLINLVKFITINNINDERINEFIAIHFLNIEKNLEFRLMCNHLLTNLIAINIYLSVFESHNEKYNYFKKKLINELKIQFNDQYEHIEQTPMYHGILLEQLLDLQNFCEIYSNKKLNIKNQLEKMLKVYNFYHFKKKQIIFFNDTNKNSPDLNLLYKYYKKIFKKKYFFKSFHSNNFHKLEKKNITIFTKCCGPTPKYNPGHSHADNLSFELFYKDNKIFTNPGVYNYTGKNRMLSRETKTHNTIFMNGKNSSQIWSNFRIGKKAETKVNIKKKDSIEFEHNGYSTISKNIIHKRKIELKNNSQIILYDKVFNANESCFLNLNFHPSITNIKIKDKQVFFKNKNINGKIILNYNNIKLYKSYYFEKFFFKRKMNSLKIKLKNNESILRIKLNG